MINLTLNNRPITIESCQTLSWLLNDLGLKTEGCAVAVNESIIAKSQWQHFIFNDGDSISLFQAIAGG
ncbi:sulfur carrier protein ThiS [Vibrio genomosp. F6]|uniref:sulfur carrier protein ThiS n=1 Tax=Vibrio genomosp. F6 TaxID=723172 RepID=UPI0010BD8FBD|nr:sulfur carrier protein ThiS [Vibrio genomosp. F6]TKF24533.1 sulfur carrier protein ThiS [Vibrio genomosp. F6]